MGLDLEYIPGQTPLDEDEKEGLLIETIATRGELDEFEQQNIEDAMQWVFGSSLSASAILAEKFVRSLHRRMLGEVWSWAGQFRRTGKNLEVDHRIIPIELKKLCDDTRYWIDHDIFEPDELALRFKHKIVCIHCFANGNGRHSRLMADIVISKVFGLPLFNWGAGALVNRSEVRDIYLRALRAADCNEFEPLIKFARS